MGNLVYQYIVPKNINIVKDMVTILYHKDIFAYKILWSEIECEFSEWVWLQVQGACTWEYITMLMESNPVNQTKYKIGWNHL